MSITALVKSMRLRTLPLSLAGVLLGGALGLSNGSVSWGACLFLLLTTAALQVLSNMSNELGDYRSGVDGDGRQGPNYSLAEGGLTERQMVGSIKGVAVACCIFGLAMIFFSFGNLWQWQPLLFIALGATAIWAATHYTLGKHPYGYRGWGDLFVFIFFGLVSVMGSYYITAHTISPLLCLAAAGIGLLSVGVLNVNNIRDMKSDAGLRRTVPLIIGAHKAKIYQTVLVVVGFALVYAYVIVKGCTVQNTRFLWLPILTLPVLYVTW